MTAAEIANGFHPGLSYEQYDAIPALRWTDLAPMMRSAAHCKHRQNNAEEKDSFKFGGLVHAYLFEPEEISKRYAVWGGPPRNTKAGKEEWKAFLAANEGKEILDKEPAAMEVARNIAIAIHSHPIAGPLMRATGKRECSIVWDCLATGVRCKARFDLLVMADGVATSINFKTEGQDARPFAFARKAVQMGYLLQEAHYRTGLHALGLPAQRSLFLVVEKEPPHALVVYEVRPADLEAATRRVMAMRSKFARCRDADDWPGYEAGIQYLDVPAWAWGQDDE